MVLDFLKNIFTGGEKEEAKAETIPAGEAQLVDFVEYIVKGLVSDPGKVDISTVEKDSNTTIEIRCEKSDIAKVIGKSGRTISAIRLLVNGAANRDGRSVKVDVID